MMKHSLFRVQSVQHLHALAVRLRPHRDGHRMLRLLRQSLEVKRLTSLTQHRCRILIGLKVLIRLID